MKTYTPFNMMNAVAHTPVNATQANASLWEIVHAQKDSFELLLIQTAAAQLSDASHVNTLLLNQQEHQSHASSLILHQMMSLAHHLTHVMIAGVMNDSTETAGHQKPAHTVNATLTDKSVVVRPNVQP
jgi:hypothetical protein